MFVCTWTWRCNFTNLLDVNNRLAAECPYAFSRYVALPDPHLPTHKRCRTAESSLLPSHTGSAAPLQEVASLRQSHQEQLRAEVQREGQAAEARGRAAAEAVAHQEKSAAQEQLSYLKVQMQYALKEGEREVEELTARLQQVRFETKL